ncbi:MAG: urea transporter ATP-binding protein [Thermomicrobiales bacterium]|nr:urea transporter ATP-binding protein [Thermomicrobiales bacterium]
MADPIPASPLLVLKGVSKRFGGLRAVSDLDLAVGRGELRCLIGPNGAGKSTVFKLIVGFERPTTGSITFDGEGIDRWPTWKRARQGLSIKMQIPGVYPELTVEDNMRVAAQYHVRGAQMEEAIAGLLARVGLSGTGPMLTKNLSHGEQQWLEIGMALSVNPKLLLLDEPTAGMGPGETEATGRLIESLNADGVTILVIEHDMAFVRQIARTVTVLHLGRIFAEGTIADIEANQDVTDIYLGRT